LTWTARSDTRYQVYRSRPGEEMPLRPIHDRPIPSGEYLDASATPGARFVYTVRVVTGDPPPYVEGHDADPVEIDVTDVFPPVAPRGLVAVQEGRSVRLFWDPSTERDLLGYRVYRQDVRGGPWAPIGPSSVDRPLVLDDSISPGRAYAYRITAVDRASPPNESEPSSPVEIEVSHEPATGARPTP
jgi:hypothetical protein